MKIALLYDTFETHNQEYNDLYCDYNDVEAMRAVFNSLINLGHNVTALTDIHDIRNANFVDYDLVFNVFEGTHSRNREALITGKLELEKIPFVGADAYIGIVSLDKMLSKLIASHLGIRVPKCLEYAQLSDLNQDIRVLRLPVIVKPCAEGNSAGTECFQTYEDAECYIRKLLKRYDGRVLCEEFIVGKELTVPIIGNGDNAYCLGVAGYQEQDSDDFWLDYRYKLFGGFTDCVAQIPEESRKQILNQALQFYRYICCPDYGRIDFRLSQDGTPYFLELNAYPTLSPHGSFVVLGKELGLDYNDIIRQIIEAATERISHSKTI